MASVEIRPAHSTKSGEVFSSLEDAKAWLEGKYDENGRLREELSIRLQGGAVNVSNKAQADEVLDRQAEREEARVADQKRELQPHEAPREDQGIGELNPKKVEEIKAEQAEEDKIGEPEKKAPEKK